MSESDENLAQLQTFMAQQSKASECSKAGCSAYATHTVSPSGKEREGCSLCEQHSIAWASALGGETRRYRLAELSMDVELHALHGPRAVREDAVIAADKLMLAEGAYETALNAWLSRGPDEWQPGDKVWYEPSDGIRFAGVVTAPGTLDDCLSVFLGWVYFQWKGRGQQEGNATAIAGGRLSRREGTQQIDDRLRIHDEAAADPGVE